MMKFWKHVEASLLDIKNTTAYYVGGTLSLDLGNNRGICLNLDGSGFVLNPTLKCSRVYQPEAINKLVRDVYLMYKGRTEHFERIEKNFH